MGVNDRVRVCYFGTYDKNRPRNRNIIEGLKKEKVEVLECHYSPWGRIEDKSALQGSLQWLFILAHFLIAYPYLIFRYIFLKSHDVVIVGYLGHIDMFIARPLASLMGKPLIFDAFLSLYDTVVNDRKLSSPGGFIGRLCFFIDRTACRMADIILLDTDAHIDYFVNTFRIPRGKFRRVFVSADESRFYPEELPRTPDPEPRIFRVLFYGQFIPLHGIEFIIQAAKILEQDRVEFTIIGTGQDYRRIRTIAHEIEVKNIRWIDWVKGHELVHYINESDAVLGIFGDSEKAGRVIPNKVFQTIACRRPVITGDSPASRELFKNEENALLCRRGDPIAIATSIRILKDKEDLRKKIGERGYQTFLSRCTITAVGEEVKWIIQAVVKG